MNVDIRYEKNLIVNNKELHYRGIFHSDDLFRIINKALTDRGYEKREKKSEELVTEAGKRTIVELRPFKAKAGEFFWPLPTKEDYVFYMIKIKIILDNVTETKENNHKFLKGEVTVSFDSWLMTDLQRLFKTKPIIYFLKGVINRYFYKFPIEEKFPAEVRNDTDYIYRQVSQLLKSYQKPAAGVRKTEEEIRKEMEEEMKKGFDA